MGKERKRPLKPKPLLEPVAEDGSEGKLARALGSVDYHTRERGLQAVALWLSRRQEISELEMAKLWKGIFYAFWHSDKQPVQEALAERLSELVAQLPEGVARLYYAVFIATMRREWFGIDHLRLDKFLMLVRKFFRAVLGLLRAGGWDAEEVDVYTQLWLTRVLLPADSHIARGLAYHLCDVLLPELSAVAAAAPSNGSARGVPQQATLRALLEPFCQALARTRDPALIFRLRQGVFEPLLAELSSQPDSAWQPVDAAALGVHLFDLGAQQETRARNREALYAISSALEKAARQQQQQAGAGRKQPAGQAAAAESGQQHHGKKKKKKRSAGEASPGEAVPGPESLAEQQRAAAAEAATVEPAAQDAAAAAAPASGKKARGKKGRAAAAGAEPAAAQGPPQAEQQQPEQAQPPKKKRKKAGAAAAAATPGGGDSTPAPAGPSGSTPGGKAAAGAAPTTGKKNVRFSLKRNLVMTIGQPPLPEDVRTPPTSKPKGPALKASSSVGAKEAPRSAPGRLSRARQQQQQQQGGGGSDGKAGRSRLGAQRGSKSASKVQGTRRALAMVSPHAVPRAKAAEFF